MSSAACAGPCNNNCSASLGRLVWWAAIKVGPDGYSSHWKFWSPSTWPVLHVPDGSSGSGERFGQPDWQCSTSHFDPIFKTIVFFSFTVLSQSFGCSTFFYSAFIYLFFDCKTNNNKVNLKPMIKILININILILKFYGCINRDKIYQKQGGGVAVSSGWCRCPER